MSTTRWSTSSRGRGSSTSTATGRRPSGPARASTCRRSASTRSRTSATRPCGCSGSSTPPATRPHAQPRQTNDAKRRLIWGYNEGGIWNEEEVHLRPARRRVCVRGGRYGRGEHAVAAGGLDGARQVRQESDEDRKSVV